MGLRAGVFVCVTSFLLGSLFTHWIADSLTLWKSPITDNNLWTAAAYYRILANSPPESLYLLAGVVALGAVTILWSLNDLRAGNIMFDGGSIFLFGTTIFMYLNSVLPSISSKFSDIPIKPSTPFPLPLRTTTLELASNHLICSVALTGILFLQAGRYFAENADGEDDEEYVMVDTEDLPVAPTTKPAIPSVSSRAKTPEPAASSDREYTVKPLRLGVDALN